MDKKNYLTPAMEITEFETEDVITTSPGNQSPWTPDPDETDPH